jgi:hypothetical protein
MEHLRPWLRQHPATCTYVVVALAVFSASLFVHAAKVLDGPILELKEPGDAAIALAKDISTLCGTWAAALLAGAATVCVKGREWSLGWTPVDSIVVIGALAGGVLTYYGIYSAYIAVFAMAAARNFAPLSVDLKFAIATQYYAALGGTLLLGLVFARMLDRRVPA